MTPTRSLRGTPGRKRTMFCHECGFEGDMHDDFLADPVDGHLEYVCPECSKLLSRRPQRSN